MEEQPTMKGKGKQARRLLAVVLGPLLVGGVLFGIFFFISLRASFVIATDSLIANSKRDLLESTLQEIDNSAHLLTAATKKANLQQQKSLAAIPFDVYLGDEARIKAAITERFAELQQRSSVNIETLSRIMAERARERIKGLVVQLQVQQRNQSEVMAWRMSTLLAAFLLGGIVILMLLQGLSINRMVLLPLKRLLGGTRRIMDGDFSSRIDAGSRDELGRLADAFNRMTHWLETATVSREYVDSIIGSMENALLVVTPDGRIVSVNRALLELFDSEEGELLNQPAANLFEGGCGLDELLKLGVLRGAERTFIAKKGGRIPVLLSGAILRDTHGDLQGVVCVATDISRRKEAEERIRKSENTLLAVVETAQDCVLFMDHEGKVTGFNPAAEEVFGYRSEEVMGRKMADLIIPAPLRERHRQGLRRFLATGEHRVLKKRLELTAVRKNGVEFPVELTITPIHTRNTPIFAGFLRDITERKLAEEALRKAKEDAEIATQAKSAFLAAMSHEIRTPMNAILGKGEVLRDSGLNQEQNGALKVLTHAGENLLALINDILDLSKVEAGQLQVESVSFDLHELIGRSKHILSQKVHTKGIVLDHVIQSNCPRLVVGDPQRLQQVLLNLLGNAVKFTEKGKVSITVESQGEDRIQFAVSDTGIGIPEEQLDDIFKPFRQAEDSTSRRFGGTGLGLSICSQLVQAMGGEIQVESKVGKGSAFYFTVFLPDSTVEIFDEEFPHIIQTEIRQTKLERPTRKTSLKILLVDDMEDNRMVVTAFLKQTPHRITEAGNGEEAVRVFKSEPFDFVLMDMQMPVLDGFGATEQIRIWEREKRRPPTLIAALTANAMRKDIEKTVAAGCDMHISKPIRKARLIEAINSFRPIAGAFPTTETDRDSVHSETGQIVFNADTVDNNGNEQNRSINVETLKQLREDVGGDIAPALKKFLEKLPIRLNAIFDAIQRKDANTLAKAAHKLKGTSSIFGAKRFSDMANQLEVMGKSGHVLDDGKFLAAISAEGDAVYAEIRKILESEHL